MTEKQKFYHLYAEVCETLPTSAGRDLLDMSKLQVGANGKLLDQEGFAVAGLVHENEYVIPEWMRADPKVVQVEQWLEQKRLRGYAQGGATSESSSPVPVEKLDSSQGNVATLLQQLITEQRLTRQEMSTWVREFQVVQQLHDFDQQYATYKKVNQQNGIPG